MAPYVPPGWPTGVQPPGSPEFEPSAIAWLLDVIPSDYLLHGVLRRHPIALAALVRHHLDACVSGARNGYRTARSELRAYLPPGAIEAVLAVYRQEGGRLAAAAQAADLLERGLRGEVFVRQMGGGARTAGQTLGRPRQVRASGEPARPAAPAEVRDDRRSAPGRSRAGRAAPGQSPAE